MAATITIPKLNARVPSVQLSQIDINDDPYASIASAAQKIGGALAALDAAEAQARAYKDANDRARAVAEGKRAYTDLDLERPLRPLTPSPGANTDKTGHAYQTWFGYAFPRAIEAQATANTRRREDEIDDALSDLAVAARLDPMRFDRHWAEEIAEHASPERRVQLKPRIERVNEAYWRGMIEHNPQAALEMLRSRKGYAQEDLGISEDLRTSLEEEADARVREEQGNVDAQRAARRNHSLVGQRVAVDGVATGAISGSAAYAAVAAQASYVDPQTVRSLDSAVAARHEQEHASVSVGKAIAFGKEITWDALTTQGFDHHSVAVARKPEEMVTLAKVAGRTPRPLVDAITKGAFSQQPTERAKAYRLVTDLSDADAGRGRLIAPIPPQVMERGYQFRILTNELKLDDTTALNRIQAAQHTTALQREARGHYFDNYLGGPAVTRALETAFGAKVTVVPDGAVEDNLVYRPADDPMTLDPGVYDPSNPGEIYMADSADAYGGSAGGMIYGGSGPVPVPTPRWPGSTPKAIFSPDLGRAPPAQGDAVDGAHGPMRSYRVGNRSIRVPTGESESDVVAGIDYLNNLRAPDGSAAFADGAFANDSLNDAGIIVFDKFGRPVMKDGVPESYTWEQLRLLGQLAKSDAERWPPPSPAGVKLKWNEKQIGPDGKPVEANLPPDWYTAQSKYRYGDWSDAVIDPVAWGVSDDSEQFASRAQRAADGEEGFNPAFSQAIQRAKETGEPQPVDILLIAEPPLHRARGLALGQYSLRVKGMVIVKDGRYRIVGRATVEDGGDFDYKYDGERNRTDAGKFALGATQYLPDPTAWPPKTIATRGRSYKIRANRDAEIELWGFVR